MKEIFILQEPTKIFFNDSTFTVLNPTERKERERERERER